MKGKRVLVIGGGNVAVDCRPRRAARRRHRGHARLARVDGRAARAIRGRSRRRSTRASSRTARGARTRCSPRTARSPGCACRVPLGLRRAGPLLAAVRRGVHRRAGRRRRLRDRPGAASSSRSSPAPTCCSPSAGLLPSTARCSPRTCPASSRAARSSPAPASASPRSRPGTRRRPRSTASSTGEDLTEDRVLPPGAGLPAATRRRRSRASRRTGAARRCRWPTAEERARTSGRSSWASRTWRASPRRRAACGARRRCAWAARSARARAPTTRSGRARRRRRGSAASRATTSTCRSAASAACAPSSARPNALAHTGQYELSFYHRDAHDVRQGRDAA